MWNDTQLNSVLDPLRGAGGGYRFAQLRHTPLDPATIAAGDIDLLGDEASVAALIRRLYDLALTGVCHFRVRRSNPDKTRVTLYSPDMANRVELDLWVNLWQFDGGKLGLRFEDVQKLLSGDGAIQRLPIDLEAAVYVQHLIAKGKDLSSASVQKRLSHYANACRGSDMAGYVINVQNTRKISPAVAAATLATVRVRIGRALRTRSLLRRVKNKLVPFPRLMDARVMAFIGCDGVGKTSVTESLVQHTPGLEPMLAKQLYRQSLTFRGAYKLNKATLRRPSESVDEALAPLAFSCARRALQARLPYHRDERLNVLLLDRYLGDFLCVGRKKGVATFARLGALCRGTSWQCPIVHFVVPFSVLSSRKQEISEAGQRAYDLAMLEHYTRAGRATDYLVFCNSGTVEQATGALELHIKELFGLDHAATHVAEPLPKRPATPLENPRELVGQG